jgi:hypothetical protein
MDAVNTYLADKSYVDGYNTIPYFCWKSLFNVMINLFVSVFMKNSDYKQKHTSDFDSCSFFRLLSRIGANDSYEPTQADVAVFKSLPNAPAKASHPHTARWYRHIATYEKEFSVLPGDSKKSAADYIPVIKAEAAATGAQEDDDEVDLFGSDDEEDDAEAERVKQERLKAYAEKKAAKPKTIAKSIVTLDVL